MVRVLILFTEASVAGQQANPTRLKQLLEAAPESKLAVDTATYDELSYVLSPDNVDVAVGNARRNLADYDLVYLRRIKESIAQAIAVGKYCKGNGIAVIDEEIASRPGSMGKLTQYMQFALAGLPFPDTVYASRHSLLLQTFDSSPFDFPVIVKSVSGSRGADNYLAIDRSELESILNAQPEVHFMIQRYIPNGGDYRVWVCGGVIGPVLHRTRQSGHMNNTSQGSGAKLLEGAASLPEPAVTACIEAASLLQRDVAGVDIVFENDDLGGRFYFFEVNRAPQLEGTQYEEDKARALADYIQRKAKESQR